MTGKPFLPVTHAHLSTISALLTWAHFSGTLEAFGDLWGISFYTLGGGMERSGTVYKVHSI